MKLHVQFPLSLKQIPYIDIDIDMPGERWRGRRVIGKWYRKGILVVGVGEGIKEWPSIWIV